MALDAAKNWAKANLSTGYATGDTSVVLVSGGGAKFPAAPFNAVWYNSTDYSNPGDDASAEIVRVTVISTDTLTITRAQESTSAANHNTAGKTYTLFAGPTAKLITDVQAMDISGTAAKATVLATTRAINGVNFDGSGPITVTADATTLTGTSLKSTVLGSSLTSVGTLGALTVSGASATGALTVTGAITATGEITAYYSDARLKENIRPIEDPLQKLLAIRGVRYNANDLAASFG